MNTFEDFFAWAPWIIAAIFLLSVLLPAMIRVLREYERGVVFRLGKLLRAKGPGLVILIPIIDRMVKVDLRIVTIDVPKQEVITRDNVPVTVDAVVFFRVVDSEAAIVRVANFHRATALFAQTTLRSVLGQEELDTLLAERDRINTHLQEILDRQTDPWGVKVASVEVRDVVLPETMKRAMARQAESERERRARIINAQGEYQAAEKLVAAGRMMAEAPMSMQLRFLRTVNDMSNEHRATIILPVPIDVLAPFLQARPQTTQKPDTEA